MALHPRILASNEARIEAEYKDRHHIRWRDLPWMFGVAAICIAIPWVHFAIVFGFFTVGLLLSITVLRQMMRNRRVAPHRQTWGDWVVICYLITTSLWVVIGGAVSALRHFQLI